MSVKPWPDDDHCLDASDENGLKRPRTRRTIAQLRPKLIEILAPSDVELHPLDGQLLQFPHLSIRYT